MEMFPMDESPSDGATKREAIKVLSALTVDYSELISERRGADSLHFSESVPQPIDFRKSDKCRFDEGDYEKLIAGKYTVNGKKVSVTDGGSVANEGSVVEDGCVALIYDEIEKEPIVKPCKKTPEKPVRFERKELYDFDEHPVLGPILMVLDVVVLVLSILAYANINDSNALLMAMLGSVGVAATIGLCIPSRGGFFALIIILVRIPIVIKFNRQARKDEKKALASYEKLVESSEIEYANAVKDYERQVEEADKEYERKCDEQYKSVLKAVEEYVVACKEYFKRKKETEEDYERQKSIIKKNYDQIAKKIRAYPDIIPAKFLKIPAFESASCHALGEIESELKAYVDILESGRADTVKEATNCYIADKQAEERRRILEEQAAEQRRAARERNRILEQQAEEARRNEEKRNRILEEQASEQLRFNEEQAYQQRRQAEEERKFQERQAEEQKKQAMRQTCALTQCPNCKWQCGMSKYRPYPTGECRSFDRK